MPDLQPPDEVLLASLADRDLSALATLYDRYGRLAYSLAYRILGESEGAEDVVQDAFLSAWRGAGSYRRDRGNPRAWLLSIVHHRAVDILRRKTTFRPAPLEMAESHPSDDDTALSAEKNVEHRT
ncbi:MAG: sigma-70 family RNA polymerase sigma factor, partial [Chloroflexota bacterium]|nr:sigma-70 family RNA polymerase sigma factor [Chloroflexota bacterium]